MKKFLLIMTLCLLSSFTYSQIFVSYSLTKQENFSNYDNKERLITISPQEISISNFKNGGIETLFLDVSKIEEKEYLLDGLCKYYYCKIKDEDSKAYLKAIVIQRSGDLILALFTSDVDIYKYSFQISQYVQFFNINIC